MTPDEFRAFLTQRQVRFEEHQLQYGLQFRCASGEIFTAFQTGTVSIQGKRTLLSEEVEASSRGPVRDDEPSHAVDEVSPSLAPDRRVFIVYGHDLASRDGLELILHRMELEPIVLENLPAAGDTIIEKLERYLGEHGNIGFACVLLTPDGEGHPVGKPEEQKYRARQNVILELGMVLARLGRRRVAILYKASVEIPSDIAGLIYIPYKERIDEVKSQLFRELRSAGYTPRTEGL
jgi:predicted nucleotide-binding protein